MTTANPGDMPAFPVSDLASAQPDTIDQSVAMTRGMDLRTYIAIRAMQGLLAGNYDGQGSVAEAAWDQAQAFLAEGTQRGQL